jgi:hypothetical protein
MEALRDFLLHGRDLARERQVDGHGPSEAGGGPQATAAAPSGTPEYGTPEYGTPEPAEPPSPSPSPSRTSEIGTPQPPPPPGSSREPLLAGVALALLMVGAVGPIMLTGGGGSGVQAAGPTPRATPPAPSARVDLVDLRAGDCVLFQGSPAVMADIGVVPCTQQHDAEMSGSATLPEGPWPGESTLNRRGDDACLPVFESYVGIPVQDSRFGSTSITPDQESWDSGDRTAICLVTIASGSVSTPMAGSNA